MKTKPRNTKNTFGIFSRLFRDESEVVSGYKPKVFQLRGKEYFDFQKRGLQEKTKLINQNKKKIDNLPAHLPRNQNFLGENAENVNSGLRGLQTMNIGFYIVTPILIGVFLGLTIDRILSTKPGFTIFFICFGTVASFYNLYRLTKN